MKHIVGLFLDPASEWIKIRNEPGGVVAQYLKFILIIAAIPAFAWYIGATHVGWSLGDRTIKLTETSAMQVSLLFYLAMLVGTAFLGYMIHWMAKTYEAEGSSFAIGVKIASYTCVPLFVTGATGFYPLLWLDISLGIVAACYTVYLLYIGVPIVMQIPEQKGFLFASAMVAVGLVMMAGMLGATVILWEMGAMPVFTDM